MKQIVTIISLLLFSMAFGQLKYSRAKILTNYEGLNLLSSLGIPIDHGVHKENTFIISDFSSDQIQTARENGFIVEIIIDDVQKYYVEQNLSKTKSIDKNIGCSSIGGSPQPLNP